MRSTLEYEAGYAAYGKHGDGRKYTEQYHDSLNPYSKNSSSYYDWVQGWNDHCRDDDEDSSYQESYGF